MKKSILLIFLLFLVYQLQTQSFLLNRTEHSMIDNIIRLVNGTITQRENKSTPGQYQLFKHTYSYDVSTIMKENEVRNKISDYVWEVIGPNINKRDMLDFPVCSFQDWKDNGNRFKVITFSDYKGEIEIVQVLDNEYLKIKFKSFR